MIRTLQGKHFIDDFPVNSRKGVVVEPGKCYPIATCGLRELDAVEPDHNWRKTVCILGIGVHPWFESRCYFKSLCVLFPQEARNRSFCRKF